jgi:hypothetical protein
VGQQKKGDVGDCRPARSALLPVFCRVLPIRELGANYSPSSGFFGLSSPAFACAF